MSVLNPASPNAVLLQDHMSGSVQWSLFEEPIEIIRCESTEEVKACLARVESFVNDGYFAAGYVSYEAAAGFDENMRVHKQTDYPLLWFGIYRDKTTLPNIGDTPSANLTNIETEWHPSISREQYLKDVKEIHRRIAAGDTYQVNHTFRLNGTLDIEPHDVFRALCTAQASEYCAYLNLSPWHICSASPELFFQYDNGKVLTKPMKGTAQRTGEPNKDIRSKHWLQHSEKNRAENVMIVDMLRNDLGKIAKPNSVEVASLCDIESYPTVYQMTSTITANSDASPFEVFRQMFPCASVTGAPKIKTMEIIRSLETSPRGIYTGSIGYFSPDNVAQFNVAIRTAVLNSVKASALYGVGSGVIWDSNAEEEFLECIAKSAILKV